MVSIGPYSTAMNYTQMFNIPDLRGPLPEIKSCKGTILNIIDNEFPKFRYIIKLAKLENYYNDPLANCTLFVPSNEALNIINNDILDISRARNIVKGSTLNRKITSAILEDSPSSWFYTKNPFNKLFITNINGKTNINNNINIIHTNIQATNGLIHVIDNLILPKY